MNAIPVLLYNDILFILRWFRRQRLSKALVVLGFFVVFASLSLFLFFYSRVFFRLLLSYESYGIASVHYLLHAAIVLLLWFATGSSMAATVGFLLTPNLSRDYLLTLPVGLRDITVWLFIRSAVLNMFFLAVILSPIAISFAIVFNGVLNASFFIGLLFILLELVVVTGSIGGILGYFIAPFIKGKEKYFAMVGSFLFLAISYLLIQIIFPTSLELLYEAPSEEFFTLFQNLPLSNSALPTSCLVDALVWGLNIKSLYLLLATFILGIVVIHFQTGRFAILLQDLKGRAHQQFGLPKIFEKSSPFIQSRHPLVLKDWYTTLRTPSEVSYALFLLSVFIFFFLFLYRATSGRSFNPLYKVDILVFSFVWLMFFTTAYLLRIVFPLMAREGPSSWHMFTFPIKRQRILSSKLFLGILLSVPLFALSFLIWFLFPFAREHISSLSLFSVCGIFILVFSQGLLGAIFPNFESGSDPEKVSTSAMGLIALFVSTAVTGFTSFLLYSVLIGNLKSFSALSLIIIGSIPIILFLYTVATYSLSRYQF